MRTNGSKKKSSARGANVIVRILVVSMAVVCSSNFDQYGGGAGRTRSTLDFGSTDTDVGSGGQGGRASSDGGSVGGRATGGAGFIGGSFGGSFDSGFVIDAGPSGEASLSGPHSIGITISSVPNSTPTQGSSGGGT